MKLSERARSLAVFEAPANLVADGVGSWMARYGPVERGIVSGRDEALGYLLPLATLSLRYLIAPVGGWSAVISNSRMVVADGLLVPVASRLGVRSALGWWFDDARMWEVVENGVRRRGVVCYSEGSQWKFAEEGQPLEFEDLSAYARRRTRDRLTGEMVRSYLAQLIGVDAIPTFADLISQEMAFVTRSAMKVVVPIVDYDVEVDIE